MTPDQNKAFTAARSVINPKRANDIRRLMSWKHGGCLCLGAKRPTVPDPSPEEEKLIRSLWDTLSASSCWMTALFMLCNEQQPQLED
jgi:hypothetical protein